MSRLTQAPANCNMLPPPPETGVEVEVAQHDQHLSTLHVVESDHMDSHHYRALAMQLQSREVGTSRTAVGGSGVRRKRSR